MAKYLKKKKHGGLALRLSAVCLLLVVVVAMNSIIDAKYVTSKRSDPAAVAKAFYFESDLLKADGNPTYYLPAGTTQITVRLKNNVDSLRHSEVDFEYTISATGQNDQKCTLYGNKVDFKDETFTNLAPGTYTVTATTTSPYSKTLSAVFVIPASGKGIEYSVKDVSGSPVLQMTVRTNQYSGNVKISWPAGVSPDNTDPLLVGAAAGQSSTVINFANDSEYIFLFFKDNPSATYEGFNAVESP